METPTGPPVGPDTVVVAAASVLSTSLGDEVVLVDPIRGVYFSLNEVGGRIWELLGEPRSIEDVSARLVEEYEVEPERCLREVSAVITELLARELVQGGRTGS